MALSRVPWQRGEYRPSPHGETPSGGHPRPSPGALPDSGGFPRGRPLAVEIAFWIAVAVPLPATVLNVVGFVVVKTAVDDVYSGTGGSSQEWMYELHDTVNGFTFFVFLVLTGIHLILSGLWIVLGFRMRDGRNRARMTLTAFASLWALSSLVGLIQGDTKGFTTADTPPFFELPGSYLVLDYARSALGLLAMGAFIVLVFRKQSNAYFTAVTRG